MGNSPPAPSPILERGIKKKKRSENEIPQKPIVIEAMQFTGKNGWEIRQWSNSTVIESPDLEPKEGNPTGEYLQIHTLEGVMTAIVNDWIIRGVNGEFIHANQIYLKKHTKRLKRIIKNDNEF